MELREDFAFGPTPPINTPLVFSLPAVNSDLGPLAQLPGMWTGEGFNMIWRPFNDPSKQDRFLELNLTSETLEFNEIKGPIPNRGLLQLPINMFGVHYLQQIQDANTKEGLHIEPGIWATVPATVDPKEQPTVVRMASIPHGTTVLAQGIVLGDEPGPPDIQPVDITPFAIGNPAKKFPFDESKLNIPTNFRTPPADLAGIDQGFLDNPNSVLTAISNKQSITRTVTLLVSSDPIQPVVGGGTSNTAFLQGGSDGPNASAARVKATFWIETVTDANGSQSLQLQYTQTVLLNFNGLSWPHITVATLRKLRNSTQRIIVEGDNGDGVKQLERALRRSGNLGVAVDGVFSSGVTAAVKNFQLAQKLKVDGIVGPDTWHALPDGGPMPTLHTGTAGDVVKSLQNVLTLGAAGQWNVAPNAADGNFGNDTQASVIAFQKWAGVNPDGIVGDATWSAPLQAANATLENQVGLNFVQS